MMKKYTLWLFVTAGVLFSGCSKEDDVPGPDNEDIQRTLLMYVIADTNISGSLKKGVDYFYQSLTPSVLANNRMVVYWDGPAIGDRSGLPELFEVTFDKKGNLIEVPIKNYTEQVNSADADVFGAVLKEVMRLYPAKDYGLIMSSHATGWLPEKVEYSRSIGDDNGRKMEIPDLAAAIPNGTFNFMFFDVCHMACVEVAYELRNKTKYILASPAETLVEGYPYQLMGAELFKPEVNWKKVIDTYSDYYMGKPDPDWHSVAQSVIATDRLEALAQFTNGLLQGRWDETMANSSYRKNAQNFDKIGSDDNYLIYDMGEFVERLHPAAYDEFTALISNTVPYYRHSDRITCNYNRKITVNRYSGLGTYIPTPRYTAMNDYYQTLEWYKAVYE